MNEFVKVLSKNWILYLQLLFNSVLHSGSPSRSWSDVLLSMLYKKGDKADPANYQSIALVNGFVKLSTQIINEKLCNWAIRHNLIQ